MAITPLDHRILTQRGKDSLLQNMFDLKFTVQTVSLQSLTAPKMLSIRLNKIDITCYLL